MRRGGFYGSSKNRRDPLEHDGKYGPGRDPLEVEETRKKLVPNGSAEYGRQLAIVDAILQEPGLKQEEYKAMLVWKTNLRAAQIKPTIHEEWLQDFWKWLLGRGKDTDHAKTWWHRQSLADDPEVCAYIEAFVVKMTEFKIKLEVLRRRRPKGINESYLYFKYIVRGAPTDKTNFLEDWQHFIDEFDAARDQGQLAFWPHAADDASNRPDNLPGNAHETAPYDDLRGGKLTYSNNPNQKPVLSTNANSDDPVVPPTTDSPGGDGGGGGGGGGDGGGGGGGGGGGDDDVGGGGKNDDDTYDDNDNDDDDDNNENMRELTDEIRNLIRVISDDISNRRGGGGGKDDDDDDDDDDDEEMMVAPTENPDPPMPPQRVRVETAESIQVNPDNPYIVVDDAENRAKELEKTLAARDAENARAIARLEQLIAAGTPRSRELKKHQELLQQQFQLTQVQIQNIAENMEKSQAQRALIEKRLIDMSIAHEDALKGEALARQKFSTNMLQHVNQMTEALRTGRVADTAAFEAQFKGFLDQIRATQTTMTGDMTTIEDRHKLLVAEMTAHFGAELTKMALKLDGDYAAAFAAARQENDNHWKQTVAEQSAKFQAILDGVATGNEPVQQALLNQLNAVSAKTIEEFANLTRQHDNAVAAHSSLVETVTNLNNLVVDLRDRHGNAEQVMEILAGVQNGIRINTENLNRIDENSRRNVHDAIRAAVAAEIAAQNKVRTEVVAVNAEHLPDASRWKVKATDASDAAAETENTAAVLKRVHDNSNPIEAQIAIKKQVKEIIDDGKDALEADVEVIEEDIRDVSDTEEQLTVKYNRLVRAADAEKADFLRRKAAQSKARRKTKAIVEPVDAGLAALLDAQTDEDVQDADTDVDEEKQGPAPVSYISDSRLNNLVATRKTTDALRAQKEKELEDNANQAALDQYDAELLQLAIEHDNAVKEAQEELAERLRQEQRALEEAEANLAAHEQELVQIRENIATAQVTKKRMTAEKRAALEAKRLIARGPLQARKKAAEGTFKDMQAPETAQQRKRATPLISPQQGPMNSGGNAPRGGTVPAGYNRGGEEEPKRGRKSLRTGGDVLPEPVDVNPPEPEPAVDEMEQGDEDNDTEEVEEPGLAGQDIPRPANTLDNMHFDTPEMVATAAEVAKAIRTGLAQSATEDEQRKAHEFVTTALPLLRINAKIPEDGKERKQWLIKLMDTLKKTVKQYKNSNK